MDSHRSIVVRESFTKKNGNWVLTKKWFLEYEPYEYTEENIILLSQKIRDNLNPKFLSVKYREKNKTNPMFGHCYHSTQALYYFFLGDEIPSLKSYSGIDEENNTHWWLQDNEKIIDVTSEQYNFIKCPPPYSVGKPTKWYGWRNRPHKRSMQLMKNIEELNANLYCEKYET